MLLGPINMNKNRSEKSLMILNHLAMAFCFGSMFVDTVKMVFVADSFYDIYGKDEIDEDEGEF